MFVGPFLVNGIAALKCGFQFHFSFNLSDPGFREWFRLTLPLMLGVSLVSADDWIMRHFASGGLGDITRLNYAKRLIAVPIAVLGQAAGQASLPFFAKLWGEKRVRDFADTVNGAVYRIAAASFLVSALLMATALPLVDLLYRRGRFHFTDSQETAAFFFWFSLSLAFWAAQGLYARAFYAAANTLVPMVAATLLTIASIPIYGLLFHQFSVTGLAIASDLGILANTIAVAVLLSRRNLVPAAGLKWGELAKAAVAAVVAGVLGWRVASLVSLQGSRRADLESLALGTLTWAAAVAAGLWIMRSELPRDMRRRKVSQPAVD
jgi:putative peptidoglycan lipid II flippase